MMDNNQGSLPRRPCVVDHGLQNAQPGITFEDWLAQQGLTIKEWEALQVPEVPGNDQASRTVAYCSGRNRWGALA